MIFIVAKFTVRPDYSDDWLERVRSFTESTRREPGNLWFEWSRSLDDPNQIS
jgi:quinol monooxygenase YgiN